MKNNVAVCYLKGEEEREEGQRILYNEGIGGAVGCRLCLYPVIGHLING